MLVWQDEQLLLIERKKPPFGFAPPAGHVDDFGSYEAAVRQELLEEVGLTVEKLELLIEGRKENACRREAGSWHYWKIYQVEVSGEVRRSEDETKQVRYCSREELARLAEKTERYLRGDIPDSDWEASPGIEPVWYEWLKKLEIT